MEEKEKKERTVIHLYIKENDTTTISKHSQCFNAFEYFSPDILGFLRFFTKLRIIQRKNFSKLKVHHSKRNPFVKIGE